MRNCRECATLAMQSWFTLPSAGSMHQAVAHTSTLQASVSHANAMITAQGFGKYTQRGLAKYLRPAHRKRKTVQECCSPFMSKIRFPGLDMRWVTNVDMASSTFTAGAKFEDNVTTTSWYNWTQAMKKISICRRNTDCKCHVSFIPYVPKFSEENRYGAFLTECLLYSWTCLVCNAKHVINSTASSYS